jgi:cytoskeletal protein CcmA (bactofilin family)
MLFSRKSASRESSPAPIDAAAQPPTREPLPAVVPPGHGHIASDANGTHTQSYIDASLTIVGDLHSEGDVRIDGRICGNVRCAQLIVGTDASVTGAVIAQQAIVRGRVIGTIRAPAVVIQDTAYVESEITYGSLAIDDGAFFEGAVHRHSNPLAEEPAASPLLELQRVAQTAEGTAEPCTEKTAEPCTEKKADTAATAPPALPNAKAPMANGHAPIATG